jgi:hypothetical protein
MYPSIWDRPGYPQRPGLPALVGNVMHSTLEAVLQALHEAQCTSVAHPQTVTVLRELGGYTVLLQREIDRELDRLRSNPRAIPVVGALETAVRLRVPDMRQRVQALVARVSLNPQSARSSEPGDPTRGRDPLGNGTHPEVDLHAKELRFKGRADLITLDDVDCVLTDYKTGAPDPHHLDQLRTYALLWSRDTELNPRRTPVSRLVIAYPSHDEVFDGPTPAELDELELDITARIASAEDALSQHPPPARPEAEKCRFCAVRHICEEYWPDEAATRNSPRAAASGSFVDCEISVLERNGPRSWIVAIEHDVGRALLQTPTETISFRRGERARLLGVAFVRDEDTETSILTLTQTSETFLLSSLDA